MKDVRLSGAGCERWLGVSASHPHTLTGHTQGRGRSIVGHTLHCMCLEVLIGSAMLVLSGRPLLASTNHASFFFS